MRKFRAQSSTSSECSNDSIPDIEQGEALIAAAKNPAATIHVHDFNTSYPRGPFHTETVQDLISLERVTSKVDFWERIGAFFKPKIRRKEKLLLKKISRDLKATDSS